jgi:superfamily II DNA/RNA helicase
VHQTLAALAPALGLACGLAAAQVPVAAEAAAIVGRPSAPGSGVDVLVATPGRLTAHLRATPGFTLR